MYNISLIFWKIDQFIRTGTSHTDQVIRMGNSLIDLEMFEILSHKFRQGDSIIDEDLSVS